jgi:hypothetical protein
MNSKRQVWQFLVLYLRPKFRQDDFKRNYNQMLWNRTAYIGRLLLNISSISKKFYTLAVFRSTSYIINTSRTPSFPKIF